MTLPNSITARELLESLDPATSPDPRRREGWWGMACWNGLSPEQQTMLIEKGNLPLGYVAEGPCPNGAEVMIETRDDVAPGPRFYCRPCGSAFLA
jgi:hypothetical protein